MPTLVGATPPISLHGPFDKNGDLPQWLNVIQDLRRNQDNPQLDVMLVQFLLIQVLNRTPVSSTKSAKTLTITGFYGEITEGFVRQFQGSNKLQNHIQPQKSRIPVGDGVVTKAPVSAAGRHYTIYRLQWAMADLAPTEFQFMLLLARAGKLTSDFLKSGKGPTGIPFPLGLQIFFKL